MQIAFTDHTKTISSSQFQLLEAVLDVAAKKEQVKDTAELSVSIVDNEEIKQLNHTYRNINEPTDVLSFEMDDPFLGMDEDDPTLPILLGDVIISIDKVYEQKDKYNHSFERELAFLAVHGLLHLLGYTHDDKESEKIMFEKQYEILKECNLER